MINQLPEGKKIIIFDGVCNLCNSSINYVIDNDKNDIFRFVSLQSDLGIALQNYLAIEIDNIDSIILYNPNEAYYLRSTAALNSKPHSDCIILYCQYYQFQLLGNFVMQCLNQIVKKQNGKYRFYHCQ
jgi:predicted DCC family thiol-disulfide oxidoreductase YuxK